MSGWTNSLLSGAFSVFTVRPVLEITVAATLTAIAHVVFRRHPGFESRLLTRFQVSARRPTPHILAAMILPVALRLVLLPWLPPPEPRTHDEFGHLLVADTLVAGRLANPPHPMWRHLETIYVLQQPAYASLYPIGQGAVLAAGQAVLGSPWAGVLLSVALTGGATSWMLFGCLPPGWAAIGGLLAALDYGLSDQWSNSYWGGALCACGGALLFGALSRIRTLPSLITAFLVGVGWSILWFTRPFESILPLLVSWGCIAAVAFRDSAPRRHWLRAIGLLLIVQMSTAFVTGLHNSAVTGSWTTFPYQLSQRSYGTPQSLLWQNPIEPPELRFAELQDVYAWQRQVKDLVSENPGVRLLTNACRAWNSFVTPWYTLPFVLAVLHWKDRQVRRSDGLLAGALAASVLYPFFFPHYLAAYVCVFVLLVMRGMMILSSWSPRGTAAGRALVLFLIVGGFMMGLRIVPVNAILGIGPAMHRSGDRAQVVEHLMRFGERHVVFVQYGPSHSFHDEWVYNAAEIDLSPVVWCRAMDPTADEEVTRYYPDRQHWLVRVDRDTVVVSRYERARAPRPSTDASTTGPEEWVLVR